MKRLWIPLVLVLIHAALVAIMGASIALSRDPEAGMAWGTFFFIDYPLSLCIFAPPPTFSSTLDAFALPILFLGTVQWGTVGFVAGSVVKWLRR